MNEKIIDINQEESKDFSRSLSDYNKELINEKIKKKVNIGNEKVKILKKVSIN